ncbi:MAG TPA: YhdP family protein, partial [Burkholderiales bacterium]|nr:YhdP family protein [Burkholderiales bacterium]
SSGDAYSIGLTARTPPELGSSIELRALVDSRGPQPAAWSGRVFVQVGYTDLAAWRAWVDYPVNVRQGQGALRIWSTIEQGEVKQLTADLALADVRASLADELTSLELASVHGRVVARRLADGVEFSGRGLALVMERGPEVPKTDFQIVWRPQAGGAIGASLVDLQAIGHLVDSLPLPPQMAGLLDELAPQGRLSDAHLEWSGPFDAPTRLAARARFADLAMRARGRLPGFSGLSGSVEATPDKGKLSLDSRKPVIDLPGVFADPRIALDSLTGQLEWERDRAGAVTVRVASLTFTNADASGNVYGSYVHRGEGPSIDLSGVLNRADARQVARYLPATLPESLRTWLNDAIVAGTASDVRVRLRGELRQFPFTDPASGQFQVSARVEKGVLDYASGWPRIENIVGELNFERDRMEIIGRSGSILGAQLSNVRVAMPSLRASERQVQVSGEADGATADFLRFIQSTPLRETAGAFTADMKAAGRGKLRLKLELPLAALQKTRLAGDYEFAGNQVTVLPWLPPIESASGRLAFGESSFTLHDVRGRLLGGAVGISGGTRAGRGVEVLARGDASFEATRVLFDHPLRKYVSGTFGYFVTVRTQDGAARVTFESPLRGLESTLPVPLAKSAAESLPLRVEVNPSAKGERDRISFSLGALARAELQRRRQGDTMVAQRTAVWLNPERDQPIRLPERPGTLVYGSLDAFDLDRWMPLLGGDGGGSERSSQPTSLELKFGTLDAFGRRLSNVGLRASAEAAGWSANVNADELAGDVSYRAGPQPRVIARLSHFTVPADTPGTKPKPAARPSDFPALDLVADEFTFRGKRLGRVELIASRAGEDWRIERASMVNPDASLTGSGMWHAAPSRTAVQFDLEAGDAGSFLARVGQPGMVKGGKARMHGSLAWHGDPATLDFPTLSGEVRMQAENGQFLEIEPGLGKLIGLMSLQALPKRITLDFRDVFSKGFQFDRITSNAQVERGVLKLREFRMRGSAADVEMTGAVDLAHETQDLRVRVLPSLGDSAALGLTLVNPVAGVAAAIAQRILKNPLGQIFAFDYTVSGSWSDPKVVKILPPPPTEQLSN